MAKRVYGKKVQAEVSDERHKKYSDKCDVMLGGKRKLHIPVKLLVNDIINGRIYIVDGKIQIVEKK